MNTAWRMLGTSLGGRVCTQQSPLLRVVSSVCYSQVIGMYEAMPPGMGVSLQMKRVWRKDRFLCRVNNLETKLKIDNKENPES